LKTAKLISRVWFYISIFVLLFTYFLIKTERWYEEASTFSKVFVIIIYIFVPVYLRIGVEGLKKIIEDESELNVENIS